MPRLIVSLLVVGLWATAASAEVTVIYRKRDRQVMAVAYPPQPASQELANVLNSSAGGLPSDYTMVAMPTLPAGHEVLVAQDGTVTTRRRPDPEAPVKAQVRAKLAALGFTAEELRVLVP